jgi:hypothetical protein
MLHENCKTPQLPDDQLKKYQLKVQEQTIPAAKIHVIDAKEERKRKQKASETTAVSQSDFLKSDKRAKNYEKSDKRGVVNYKESKLKVTKVVSLIFHAVNTVIIIRMWLFPKSYCRLLRQKSLLYAKRKQKRRIHVMLKFFC